MLVAFVQQINQGSVSISNLSGGILADDCGLIVYLGIYNMLCSLYVGLGKTLQLIALTVHKTVLFLSRIKKLGVH